jgi:hypothetical protein
MAKKVFKKISWQEVPFSGGLAVKERVRRQKGRGSDKREPHERTLFSRFTITVDSSVLKIEKTDYASCPDFAELYKYILDENDRLGSENAEKRKKSKTDRPVNRAKRRKKDRQDKKTSLHSRFTVSQFFIDGNNDLLYNVSQTGKETLSVSQVKRDHGETLRYKLFVELHDTPLMEHRGTASTTFALRARFFGLN